jgi:hypothetical protein
MIAVSVELVNLLSRGIERGEVSGVNMSRAVEVLVNTLQKM